MDIVSFFTTNGDNVLYFLVILFVVFWIYSILWVAKDISWRTEIFSLQLSSILLILFMTPVIGLPIYFLMRPLPTYGGAFDDDGLVLTCYGCGEANSPEFAYCVFCGDSLKVACPECGEPIGSDYAYCPWCGSDSIVKEQAAKISTQEIDASPSPKKER